MSDLAVYYDQKFFTDMQGGSRTSADIIVPIVMELVKPTSVVDVGCGTGEFLAVFQQYGVTEVLGIDGDYVKKDLLAIPQEFFLSHDLRSPLILNKSYDLAICLEVGEHLPPECASDFIESLTHLAPVVLFSAAIPHQGGVDHLNEQWQEYWAQLFLARGFVPVDVVRPRIWSNPQVEVWYRQNTILYCSKQTPDNKRKNEKYSIVENLHDLSVVHPEIYMQKLNYFKKSMSVLDFARIVLARNNALRHMYYRLRR